MQRGGGEEVKRGQTSSSSDNSSSRDVENEDDLEAEDDGFEPADIMVPIQRSDFVEVQRNDPRIRDLRSKRNDPAYPAYERLQRHYLEDNGLLYLRILVPGCRSTKRLIVPATLRSRILYEYHGAPLLGHAGRNRMVKAIREKYYWPGISKDVDRRLQSCLACLRRKTPRPMKAGVMTSVLRTKPFDLVEMDFYGPLPDTMDGNRYILTMVDVFSRWPIAVPVTDRKASTVARAIYQHLICVHGCPRAIHSDRGKEFLAAGIKQMCAELAIKKIETTGFQPQANGRVERFHQWIGRMMTVMANEKKDDWDIYIDACLFAYRVSVHEAMGHSPFELVYGRKPTVPLDLLWEPEEEKSTSGSAHIDYADDIRKILRNSFKRVKELQTKAAAHNANRKKKGAAVNFEEGDQIRS